MKRFDFWQLIKVLRLLFQKPLLIIPTVSATKRTLIICDNLYRGTHHKDGKENAFRHALWNILICQQTVSITKNTEQSILWAEKITSLHEKLAPNEPLATAMDLHNNSAGREYFRILKDSSETAVINFLQEKTQNAKRIVEVIDTDTTDLIYLLDENKSC
ncbi:hypothetical protein [Aquimarina sp. RZ0]|uniref:DUF6973 domain-containing protein n=1 Tax=Aquimarina sp. RZ0 TaxID=2607730 RepID=UPI0012581CCA|nr:hypothetical protein [Aquimarina sp. RZ0]KAA1242849.1 hypothetical protein F0000_23665 [Aquimarina sp. RZ0]